MILPVVELPVCKVTSWLPLDAYTPAPEPLPTFRFPFIRTVPLTELVIVSSFSKIIPVEPVTSILVLNTPVVAVKAAVANVPPATVNVSLE